MSSVACFPMRTAGPEAAALSFERSFRTAVDRTEISPVPGAEEAIGQLSESGLRVCLITSLSRRLLGLVLDSLRWWRLIDLTLCPEDVPRGCPWPDLMLTAMLRLGVEDVRETAFAGSTGSEIQCGQRSGAGVVAGVLTGGHTSDRLRAAGATHLIDGIAQLPGLLLGSSTSGTAGSAGGAARWPAATSCEAALHAAGVGTDIHYPLPSHLQPACADLGHGQGLAAGDRGAGRAGPLAADVPGTADRARRARGRDRLAAGRRAGHANLMEREQYDLMFAQEERHWWYVGMRRISAALLERYPPLVGPVRPGARSTSWTPAAALAA